MPKIYPGVDEAKEVLLAAAEYTNWNEEAMLDIICNYIDEHHGIYGLLDYIQELIDKECEDKVNSNDSP